MREAGVAMTLYPLTAFRMMSAAAELVYKTLRAKGTQKELTGQMQTRDQLYQTLNYHDYETKLDKLFAQERTQWLKARSPSSSPAWSPAPLRSAPSAARARGLHYRGYDIHDLATEAQFAEVAYLLLYGQLPTKRELEGSNSAAGDGIHRSRLQPARPARRTAKVARDDPGRCSSDGRDAQRLFAARTASSRKPRRPSSS
jgi:hypothetical protein